MLKEIALVLSMVVCAGSVFAAGKTMSMNFKNKDVAEIIEIYGKNSGEKFIIDPDVRGKMTILSEQPVDLPEAFHLMSSALALRGYAILKKEGFFMVRNARSATKDMVETSDKLPESTKPERLFTWIVKPQFLRAETFEKNLRNLISRDGDFFVDPGLNQMVITDYLSNLHRVQAIIQASDRKAN
jgi:general secretion pathway protein D